MQLLEQVSQWYAAYAPLLWLATTAFTLAMLAALIAGHVRTNRLLQRYRRLLNGPSGPDLEALLLDQSRQLELAMSRLTSLEGAAAELASEARSHLQRVGVVRFNAFADTGSDLSFSIAVLNAENDGVVLSSLFGREESRTYAKPIRNGSSTYNLSAEEKEAIARATPEK